MILNTIKSIQKFSATSRKYKDLEAVASHCTDKLKFFIGYVQLQNEKEPPDLAIEFDKTLDLKEYLDGAITNELKSIIYYVDKKKIKDLSADEYEKHIALLYPFILGPIFKACKQYTNPKLTIISLEGIHKLLSFGSLAWTFIEESRLYGCEDFVEGRPHVNGLEFLFTLLFDIYDSKIDDESIVIQIIKASMSLIERNVGCFSCQIFYSIFLTLINIYSNTIDNGIRAASYSILIHFVNMFFDDSFENRSEYFGKYFVLVLEVLYTLTMTDGMIYIKKHETQKGRLNQIRFVSPLSFEFRSEDFVEVEDNFFKFSQIKELDPRILKIRNLCLEIIHGIFVKAKLMERHNSIIKDTMQEFYKLHFLSIMKNVVLNDLQTRKNAICLWSDSVPIYDLNLTIRLHGVFISKCIRGLFENGIIEASEKATIVGSVFDTFTENIHFLTFLFVEFDLNTNCENLVLNTINFLVNQIMEGGPIKGQQKNLQGDIFTLITDMLVNLLEELQRIQSVDSFSDASVNDSISLIRKHLIGEYIQDFNEGNYEKSIGLLSEIGVIDKEDDHLSIARFLVQNKAVSKKAVGDYISLPDQRNRQILNQYCNQFSFKNQSLDFSLYLFLSNFHLPGEAQKIDRIMEEFSLRYFLDNPELFQNKDKIYIMAFSLIMLHTDAHSREIKDYYRMSKSDFIKNHNDLVISSPRLVDFLERFYDNVTLNEWIFEGSKETNKVFFPYLEYLINFIKMLESNNTSLDVDCGTDSDSSFQINIISHEVIHKIVNLLNVGAAGSRLPDQDPNPNQDLIKFIDLVIKRKFDIIYFNGVYTEDLVYWKLIANAPIQWIVGMNECLKGRKLPVSSEMQQESTYFQYDGLGFKRNSKVVHSNNILQASSVIGTNQNLSKWMTYYKTSDLKVREVNGVFQTSISDLVKELVPSWSNRQLRGAELTTNERTLKVQGSHTVLLGKMICCYFTGMLSNVDFWICFGKDTMANWIPILKYTTELGIVLGLESSFTITLTVLSYLTNVMALPLSFNDLFFCNSSMSEEIRTVLNNDIGFENEKYSKALKFPELEERGVLKQFSDLVGRSFQSGLNNYFSGLDSRQENKVKDENERLATTHLLQVQNPSQGSDILLNYLISSEAFSTYSSLNYLNIEAIKTIFGICQHFGDKVPYVLWVIVIGIISQVDRYFYVKSILKGSNNAEIPDHYYSDHNKFLINKSKIFGNDLSKFLTLSKICINTTKSQATNGRHLSQIFNRKLIKSTKSIFNSTKSVINSGLSSSSRDNSRSISRASSSRETSPDFVIKDEETNPCRECAESSKPSATFQNVVVIHGQNFQYVQIYMNLRSSISLNNLWFKEEEIIQTTTSGSSVGSNDEILWIDEDKYGLILNQVSLINLRRTEMINSKLITNELEFFQVMERIFTGITMDPSKNKKVITDLFLALIFNARNQIVLSGRRSIELFLFRKVFEFLDILVSCCFRDFSQVILWDRYFIPMFYAEIIQILDGKAYLEVLDLIKSFVTKYIRSQNNFIRSEYLRVENDEEAASSNGGEKSWVVSIIISSQPDSSPEERALGELDSNFQHFPLANLSNLTQFSIFTLFKKLLEVSLNNQPYGGFVATVELSLEILSNIQNLYQDLRLFNFLDLCEILEIYQYFIIGIQKCTERSQERNTSSYANKKKKLISLLSSTSHSNKEDSFKNKENEVLSRVSFCLISVSKVSFLFDDSVFSKLMDTLFIMLKLFASNMDSRQVCKILDHILYMFYHKIKYVYTLDLEDDNMYNRLSTFKSQRPASNNNSSRLNAQSSSLSQLRLLLKYWRDFSQLVTSILVFERKLLDLYYHYLVSVSKIINYWLGICPNEQQAAFQEICVVENITSDVIGLITLNNRTAPNISIVASESGKRKGVKFLDKLVNEEGGGGGGGGAKGGPLEDDSGTEEYCYDDYDIEAEEEDDEDNCLVNDEADLGIIRYISYSSSRNEKSTFEVTNKSSHLDNTQLTLSNLEEMKIKTSARSNLAMFNRKMKEINRALAEKTEDEEDLISDELLESGGYDGVRSIKSDRECGDSKIMIIHNVYKIIEFYIFKMNVTCHRFLFKDWLILSNQVLLSQVMNMFCKDDIRIQYRMVIIYLNFLFSNKSLFGYREWHQVFQYYSSFLIELTKSTQIDPNKYIIEDVRSRYSIDDFGVAYGDRGFGDQVEKRVSKDDGAVDSRKCRQRTQFEIFFRSKIFNKKYLGLVESKKSHNHDHCGAESSKSRRLKSRGRRILLKQCLEKNWRCYSHKYIKNTGDQGMYDSYAGLRVAIEELVLEDLSGCKPKNGEARTAALSRPDCINDLYAVLLVIYNLIFGWYVVDLRSSERRGELDTEINKMVYETIMSSLSKLYVELVNGLNFLKFDLFQYNIFLALWTQLRIRKEFSLQFKDSSLYYKNDLLTQCEDILGTYAQIEKGRSEVPERREKGGTFLHPDGHNEKKRLSSIISSNIYFNHHFNSSYDRILKNKIDITCTYRAVLNGLLKDLKEMKDSDFIMKSSRIYKILLDITLLEDQNLRVLSRDILIEFAKRNEEPPRSPSSSPPSPAPASSSLSLEEKIVPLLDEFSS